MVTGTPGTGKTTVSLELSRRLNLTYVNLNEELIKRGLCRYNPDLATYEIVDVEKAEQALDEIMSSLENAVFDTLLVELVNPDLVDWVIVLRLNPYQLYDRLRTQRGWTGRKLCENVLAEILDYFLIKAVENVGEEKVIEVDTTGKTIEDTVREILKLLQEGKPRCGIVDWLGSIDPQFVLELDMCREERIFAVEEYA